MDPLTEFLIPRPQTVRRLSGIDPAVLALTPVVHAPSPTAQSAAEAAVRLILKPWINSQKPIRPLVLNLDPTLTLAPRSAGSAIADQAYTLTLARDIRLAARSLAGLRHGLQTLRQLLETAADIAATHLPRLSITDWPRLATRGIHLDLAREMEYRPAHLRKVVEHLAYLKFNTLHLYLENKFVFSSAPELAPPGALTPDQAHDLCRFAARLGVQIIPQIATLGHMEHLLQGRFAELREKPASACNLCPSHPQARPFLAALIADIHAAFRSPFIHVGYDESHSGVCPRCQQQGTPSEILAGHLNWLNSQVRGHGARTLIYGDQFLARADFPRSDAINAASPEAAHHAIARVDRDIIITDWHYTAPYGGTVRHLVNEGFEVHIAPATNIYWHDSIPLHRGHHWIVPTIDQAVAEGAVGVMHTNWEFYRGQFFDNFWFFQGLSAERGWTNAPHDYAAWGRRFARRFWGLAEDRYSELAGLAETLPTGRRRFFVDSQVLAVEIPSALNPLYPEWRQIRFDHTETGDELIRQARRFRRDARRHADTLRILDMPGQIARYLGVRAVAREALLAAVQQGDRSGALQHIDEMRQAARQVLNRLKFGFRVYGGAVQDRARIQTHLDDLDRLDRFIRRLPLNDLRSLSIETLVAALRPDPEPGTGYLRCFAASPLQPAPADVRSVPPPPTHLVFQPAPYLDDLHLISVLGLHGNRNGLIYLKTVIRFPKASQALLLYGADGPVKVWVNGREIDCRPEATNPAVADQFQVVVRWRKGPNELVFALHTNQGKAWGLLCKLDPK
jgi:hypothetical protein